MPHHNATTFVTRPETALLLCCARTQMDAESAEHVRVLLREDLDWAYLFELAWRQGLIPLLYQHLDALGPEGVPDRHLERLRTGFHNNARHSLAFTAELCCTLKMFESHGIAALPFKGPVLAAAVYGNLALRQFGDLDILVHKQDVLRATELLVTQGYRPQHEMTAAQARTFLKYGCQHSLLHGNGTVVELHWAFTQRYFTFPLDPESVWNRAKPVSLSGTAVLNLSPEDLLLFLCVHGAKHCWERLAWVCDVAELLRVHPGMAWDAVMAQARVLGSTRMLWLGLFLAGAWLGAPLPEAIWQRVQADPTVRALAAQVDAQLFQEPELPNAVRCFFHLRSRERLRDRIRYCVRYFPSYFRRQVLPPNERDREWCSLPASFSFLYYGLRPIRLLIQYGPGFLKHPR